MIMMMMMMIIIIIIIIIIYKTFFCKPNKPHKYFIQKHIDQPAQLRSALFRTESARFKHGKHILLVSVRIKYMK
jgi:hypothetical protein